MARNIVAPQGADLPTLIQSASEAVQEVGRLLEKVYSVASAGQAFTGEEGGTEHNLFCVIEDLTNNTSALQFAYRALNEAAAAAKGVNHV